MKLTGFLATALACSAAAFLAAPASAEPVEKWCSGVDIAAFPGGPQGGVFANNVFNGFRQAELDLGPNVTYYFSDWDPNLMLQQIQQAVATGVDGIATYGFAGQEATGPIVQQAYDAGIIFTTLNTALRDSQSEFAPQGLGFVGAPNYTAGKALGEEAVARSVAAAGDKVFVWGLQSQGGDRGQRTVGVLDAMEEAGMEVIYQEIDSATNANPNAGTATFVGLMGANPDIKVVVTDHGGLTSNVGVYAQAAGLEAGQVYFAGFDMSPNTAQAIQEGFQNLVIDQQPYLQGYLPILNICLTEKYGFAGLDINTAGAFVDATNVDVLAPLAAVEIR
ncbi:MAG: substrate-binding domain-containing protein [Pseudomonadota bacterium]